MAERAADGMLAFMEMSKQASEMPERLCTLQYALGRVEDCPGARCPFWLVDLDGAGCVVAGVEAEIETHPGLAQHLLELRLALDRARVSTGEPQARSLFCLLTEEQAGGGRRLR